MDEIDEYLQDFQDCIDHCGRRARLVIGADVNAATPVDEHSVGLGSFFQSFNPIGGGAMHGEQRRLLPLRARRGCTTPKYRAAAPTAWNSARR